MSCKELNDKLSTRSYLVGYSFSEADKTALEGLCCVPASATYPHAARWATHIVALVGASNIKFACPCSSGAAPAAAADDDDFDMGFDDEDEEDEEATAAADKARAERMAAALKLKQEADAKKDLKPKAPKPVERSLVVLEVKPWEADTDLVKVWNHIKDNKSQEGLTWGLSHKLEPVAFGVMKLVMTCSIVDSLVLMDDITDFIEGLEEWVQSVNVVSMNKIS